MFLGYILSLNLVSRNFLLFQILWGAKELLGGAPKTCKGGPNQKFCGTAPARASGHILWGCQRGGLRENYANLGFGGGAGPPRPPLSWKPWCVGVLPVVTLKKS